MARRKATDLERSQNRKEVVRYIFQHGTTTKPAIAKTLNLSLPTISTITKGLCEDGLILEVGKHESTGGRRPIALVPVYDSFFSAGIEISRTQVRIVVINTGFDIVAKATETIKFEDSTLYWSSLADLLDKIMDDTPSLRTAKLLGIGFAFDGVVEDEFGQIKAPQLGACIQTIGIAQVFSRFECELRYDRKARCLALSEVWLTPDIYDAVCIHLGEYISIAQIANQEVLSGADNATGDIRNLIVFSDNPKYPLNSLVRLSSVCDISKLTKDGSISLEAFFEKINNHDEVACSEFNQYLSFLAIVIMNLKMIFDSEIIVGGELCAFFHQWFPILTDFMYPQTVSVRMGRFKENSAAVGVAGLFISDILLGHIDIEDKNS